MSEGGSITLRLYGALQHAAGSRAIELPCKDATISSVLSEFTTRFGARVTEMVYDAHGKPWRSLIFLINDDPAENQDAPVHPGDTISILLPVAGG